MDVVPRFFLYGEVDRAAEARFIHVETITARSVLHQRRIAPHRHSTLLQLFLIASGGGEVTIDGIVKPFAAPAILTLPSGVIHGFIFHPGTEGWVVTVADCYGAEILRDIDEGDISRELVEPIVLPFEADAPEFRPLSFWFDQLAREFRWGTQGRVACISALLRLIFIAVARLQGDHTTRTSALGGDATLFARFRAQVEAWFSEQRGLTDYARALGVTEKKLNRLCHEVAGQSPTQLIHARLAIEAKRGLLYTSMNVAEIGYALGFRDPAYFSRFFRRHFGVAPSNFLAARGNDAAE